MDNLQNTSNEGTQGANDTPKTFTQEDVNRIVQERLAKERSKGTGDSSNDELTKRAAELDLRERKLNAIDTLRKEGLPDYLVEALNMNTDDDFKKSIEAIKKMKGDSSEGSPKPIGTISIPGIVGNGSARGDGLRKAFGLE